MLVEAIQGFIVLGLIFIPLELLFPLHSQPILRRFWQVDTFYYFSGFLVGRFAGLILFWMFAHTLAKLIPVAWKTSIQSQPLMLQLIAAVFIGDLGYYIAHRMLHTLPWLWKFHAVHHSVEQMDWLATVRVHPGDQVLTKLFQVIPIYSLGFSGKTLAIYVLYSAAIAFYIHANTRIQVGWLKWVVATPQFHHWHHVNLPEASHKNFAAQLPVLDWLFGTLYLPKKSIPTKYGINAAVPSGYLGQLFYPFQHEKS